MSYYRVCPLCGAALDPGERCDCQDKEEAALGVSSTQGGMVEQVLTDTVSTSSLSKNEEDCKHEL